MAKEANIEIAVSAGEELSRVTDRLNSSLGATTEGIVAAACAMDSASTGSSGDGTTISNISNEVGAGAAAVDESALSYEEKLAALNEYNAQVVLATEATRSAQAEIERKYSDESIGFAGDERDFRIQSASEAFSSVAGFLQDLTAVAGSENEALFKASKAFNIAQALMATFTAFDTTLASLPFPANVAAAASVLASGMAKVKAISATSIGSSGSSGGTSTASASVPTSTEDIPTTIETAEVQPTQTITVNVHNPLSDENWDAIGENIVAAIDNAGDRNIALTVTGA